MVVPPVVIVSALIVGAVTISLVSAGITYWLVEKKKEGQKSESATQKPQSRRGSSQLVSRRVSQCTLPRETSRQREKMVTASLASSGLDSRVDCMIIPSYGGTLPPRAVRKRNSINLSLLPGVETDLDNIERLIHEDDSKELVSVRSQFRDIHMDVRRCKECIGEVMKRTHKKITSNGLLIWYTGHGEACTGNWPFEGGYLTFSDMYELYKRHMQGKHLYIVTDCCYSGNWVKECARHLDKENTFCGHYAEERNIYLKVFASCLPDQEATDPLYTTGKGVQLLTHGGESHVIGFPRHRKLNHDQTTLGFDFTRKEKCIVDGNKCVSAESTWEQDVEDLIEAEPNDTDYIN